MTAPSTDRLCFKCLPTSLNDKILELHSNDWYIESLEPTTDHRVQVVAKKLIAGMKSQAFSDIDMKDFWFRFSQMRDFRISENRGSPGSDR
jgi:hypothetical protein